MPCRDNVNLCRWSAVVLGIRATRQNPLLQSISCRRLIGRISTTTATHRGRSRRSSIGYIDMGRQRLRNVLLNAVCLIILAIIILLTKIAWATTSKSEAGQLDLLVRRPRVWDTSCKDQCSLQILWLSVQHMYTQSKLTIYKKLSWWWQRARRV